MDNFQAPNEQLLYRWQSVNRLPSYRGKLWYLIFIALVGSFLAYALWSNNFLLAIIVLLFVFLLIIMAYQPVSEMKILMFADHLTVDGDEHKYRQIKNFWISEMSGMTYLYWEFKDDKFGKKMYNLMLLGEVNPLKIRQILLDAGVAENNNPPEVDFWEMMARLLRF